AARSGAGSGSSQAGPVAGSSQVKQVSVALRPAAGSRDEGMDVGIYGVGASVALQAGGAGIDAAGLLARSRAHGGAGQAVGAGHRGGSQAGFSGAAGSDLRVTSVAWCGADLGSDDRGRVRQYLSLQYATAVDGLQRISPQRGLQRPADAAWQHHQDGQRASETNRHRSGLELSATARRRAGVTQATRGRGGGDQRDRLESAAPIAQALYETGGGRQGSEEDHHRGGTRTAGLHLGYWDQGGDCQQGADGGLTKNKSKSKSKNFPKNEK